MSPQFMSPQFIYFDLDDTLLDHQHAERVALADVHRAFGDAFADVTVEEVQETYRAHNGPLWRAYAAGQIDKATLKRVRFERLLEGLGITGVAAGRIGPYYMERYAEHWQFVDGAQHAFEAVAARHPVGILTNGFVDTQNAKLDRFPLLRERSHAVVISEETGYMKPHPEVFAYATRRAGVEADTILYVGDSYHSDVQGGAAAGWQVAWYVRNGEAPAEEARLTFSDWDNLLRLL